MPGFPADPTGELHEPEAGFEVLLWVCKFVLFFLYKILGIFIIILS